jgi:hypothetical protein
MATPEGAQVVIQVLNRVIRYAVGLGIGASALQTSLYNGEGLVGHGGGCGQPEKAWRSGSLAMCPPSQRRQQPTSRQTHP